jgi:hypothetical protein
MVRQEPCWQKIADQGFGMTRVSAQNWRLDLSNNDCFGQNGHLEDAFFWKPILYKTFTVFGSLQRFCFLLFVVNNHFGFFIFFVVAHLGVPWIPDLTALGTHGPEPYRELQTQLGVPWPEPYCRPNSPNIYQLECQNRCQVECQNICQIECQVESQNMADNAR